MPYFRCSVISPDGKKRSIIKEAVDEQELVVSFNETDMVLVRCAAVEDSAILQFKKNFNRNIILEFTEIMASLLSSGLTIQDSAALCQSIAANPKTAWLSKNILLALQNGLPLHEALKMHAPSFSPLYQAMVKLGEQTGSVAAVFKRMTAYLRNEKKIRGKVGNVIWYPALVLSIAVIGSIGIMIFIIPRMMEIFTAFTAGANEDAAVGLAQMYRSIWLSVMLFIAGIALVIMVIMLRKNSERFLYLTDYFLLKMPVLGTFVKSIQTMDFSFAMEMLTGAGITIHTALGESAEIAGNRAYRKAIREVHAQIVKGESLSGAFGSRGEFPPYIATWIAVGERTGSVEAVFTQIREYFQGDVDIMSERLMGLMEPGLILLVGIIILFMIVQFVVPVFSLYGRLI
jgi:type II secretory pathway component PulF